MYENGIESDIDAYILGFIYADGHVSKGYKRLTFCLGKKDKDFLIQLSDIFSKHLNKIYTVKEYTNRIVLDIPCKDFCLRLKQFGLHNRKTYDNDDKIFHEIPNEYKFSFIRGYFDGDGCISYHKNYVRCSICSMNIKLLTSIQEYLFKFDINSTIYMRNDRNYGDLYINRAEDCIKFGNLLYDNMEICLFRKYIMFSSIVLPKRINKYKNIYKDGKYYTIRLTILGKRTYFGSFKTEDDALIHYNTIAESYGYKQQQRL